MSAGPYTVGEKSKGTGTFNIDDSTAACYLSDSQWTDTTSTYVGNELRTVTVTDQNGRTLSTVSTTYTPLGEVATTTTGTGANQTYTVNTYDDGLLTKTEVFNQGGVQLRKETSTYDDDGNLVKWSGEPSRSRMFTGFGGQTGGLSVVGRGRRAPRTGKAVGGVDDSGRAGEAHDRHVTLFGVVLNGHLESYARLAFDEHLRQSTRRTPRPCSPRFESRLLVRLPPTEVDFVRRRAFQRHVRALCVIPTNGRIHVAQERAARQRDEWPQTQILLQRPDGSLDQSDTAMLADRTETLLDPALGAPAFKCIACELGALVADQIFGRLADLGDDATEKLDDLLRGRLAGEHRDTDHTAGVMVKHDA